MDRLKMHTPDLAEENFKKLAALFPNAVTEKKNENGEVVRAIDADVLRQEISAAVVEGPQERYQFTWPDKKKAIILANTPIAKTLRLDREKSVGRDGTPGGIDTENIYIEGDNLDALKLLQETYLGKVKMIYIDPPYNTGKDFIYKDDFAQNFGEYISKSGQIDEQGNQLVQNLDGNGRFHTDWLNMLYPRLRLSKDLLANDGVILVSIADRELKNLKSMMDEVFGADKQVCCFVWKSRAKPTNAGNARFRPQKVSEYVLVYSKTNPDDLLFNVVPSKERTYPHEDKHGKFRTTTILTSNRGTFRRETMRFESHGYTPNEDFRWKAGKETIDRLYDTDHMYINDDGVPMEKKYEHEEADPLYPIYTFIEPDLSGTAENGKTELGNLVGKHHGFDTVKPVQLMKYLIQTFMGKDGLMLDFFSGSGTSAQACIEQNAEDGGHRRFIMVQVVEYTYVPKMEKFTDVDGEEKERFVIDPHTGYPVVQKETEALLDGFYTVPQIAELRIHKAGEKIKKSTEVVTDYGFRVFYVDSSNMKDVYYRPDQYIDEKRQRRLFAENIKPDRTPEDLLIQVMLDMGVSLSSDIEETEIGGKRVFSVAGGYLIACFDSDVTEETVKAIAQMQPRCAVFRDSGMAGDSVIANFEQIFETYSPKTQRKVL